MKSFNSIMIDVGATYPTYPWPLNCRQSDGPEVDGLWIWFPTGHTTAFALLSYLKKKLSEHPIDWISVETDIWKVDVDLARQAFESSTPWGGKAAWPSWLAGTAELAPEYESGSGFVSRISLRITPDTYSATARRKAAEARTSATVVQQFYSGVHMGPQYTVNGGQVGAMGDQARAERNIFNQGWAQAADSLDLPTLLVELQTLRTVMRKNAIEPEQDLAVASIGSAEIAGKSQDKIEVIKHLKAAGAWAFDTATKIGTSVAAKAIQSAMGLP